VNKLVRTFCVVGLLLSSAASAQFANCTGTPGALCAQQNVGIQTNGDATWPLTVGGTTMITLPTLTTVTSYPFIIRANNQAATLFEVWANSNTGEVASFINLNLYDGGGTSRIYFPNYVGDAYFTQIGKVGIGTKTPDSLLTVASATGAPRLAVGKNSGSDTDGRLLLQYDSSTDSGNINAYHSGYKQLDVDGALLRLNKNSNAQVMVGNGGMNLTGGISTSLPSTGTINWWGFNNGNAVAQTLTTSEFTNYVPMTLRDGGGTTHVNLPNYGGDAWFTNLGNFGIGTSAPNSLLTVAAPSGFTRMVVGKNTGSDVDGRTLVAYDTVGAAGFINAYAGAYRTLNVDGAPVVLNAASGGQVVIGAGGANSTNKITVNGDIYVTGNINAKYQDVAEWVPVTEAMQSGTVVVVSSGSRNTVAPSGHAYDTAIAGVVSTQPGFILGDAGASKEKIATTGRVKVRASAATAPIRAGDLLVTSDEPGLAMRSEPIDVGGVKIHRPGTLIGKALEPLESGRGEILVLLSLQ